MSTKIEWTATLNTDGTVTRGETWNPIAGCSKVSPGCKNCYAIKDAHRLKSNDNPKIAAKYAGTTKIDNGKMNWTGRINLGSDEVLTQPMRWTRPRKIFVNSMSDLFHENVPKEWIDKIFAVMALSPQHTFQILTKRPDRMRSYLKNAEWQLKQLDIINEVNQLGFKKEFKRMYEQMTWNKFKIPNIWYGTSVENKDQLHRINFVRHLPAKTSFLSLEPLLGDLGEIDLRGISWVIAGGESGHGARPVHPDWLRSIRDQCVAADVKFFFKQWGAWMPVSEMNDEQISNCYYPLKKGETPAATRTPRVPSVILHPDVSTDNIFSKGAMQMFRVGKKNAGRILDGRTWDEYPE